jgi:hypothetical protein
MLCFLSFSGDQPRLGAEGSIGTETNLKSRIYYGEEGRQKRRIYFGKVAWEFVDWHGPFLGQNFIFTAN